MARPRDIGTLAETAVVKVLRSHGFGQAERRALRGTYDCGDITGTPGLCWEVKGGDAARQASDAQIAAWMVETEKERLNAQADIGVLVVQRKGIGPANADRWWAIIPVWVLAPAQHADLHGTPLRLTLIDVIHIVRRAGYGDPLP